MAFFRACLQIRRTDNVLSIASKSRDFVFRSFSTVHHLHEHIVRPASAGGHHLKGFDEYKRLYDESIHHPETFWDRMGKSLEWIKPFSQVSKGSFERGDIEWFSDGVLNPSANCIDRHLATNGNQTAILWEGDKPGTGRKITYQELHDEVCRLANALLEAGIRKGDRVAIYMPMVPQAAYAMLACSRIGAVHSVVFAGFSAESLRDRIQDAGCRVVITADEGLRGGKVVPLKATVDAAVAQCPSVEKVFVHRHTGGNVPFDPKRDAWLHEASARQKPVCQPEPMNAEDPLFILYTSGSTGKPKGIVHTCGGYLVYASVTHKYVFDYRPGDVYACVADIGWITGHSYIVYGPLANGATTVMFEGLPTFPDAGRYWQLVEQHKINIFYTAPTAVRTLMALGDEHVRRHDRSSLRVLGSVGEPINPEAWRWLYDTVGERRCSIVDTYWQTETGGVLVTPLAGVSPMKPGSASFPFFGIQLQLLHAATGKPLVPHDKSDVEGVLAVSKPWPGIARTILGDHERYLKTYFKDYPGYYFTGDGCRVDKDGFYWITGRVDDVINKAGHRIGTAEIEGALVLHHYCAEAAVVAAPDPVKGQQVVAFCTLKQDISDEADAIHHLRQAVRKQIGAIAVPDVIIITPSLPKTRSGKIVRRLLRKIASKDTDSLGDISTLSDPEIVQSLIDKCRHIKVA